MTFKDTDPRLDAVFSALAHPIRRRLLARLERGPATVGELAAPFDVSLMAISKHVAVLEKAELVRREAEGRFTRCSLRPERLMEVSQWLESHARFWSSSFASFGNYLERNPDSQSSPSTKRR